MSDASPLKNPKEAARYLRIEERALRSIRGREEIPYVRVGYGRGRILYRQEDLDQYIRDRLVLPRRRNRKGP